jgi:hypothetical protein
MLQGFMYLTEDHICFHAYFPREQVNIFVLPSYKLIDIHVVTQSIFYLGYCIEGW